MLRDTPLEMMKKHPVEDGPLRMSGTIKTTKGGRGPIGSRVKAPGGGFIHEH